MLDNSGFRCYLIENNGKGFFVYISVFFEFWLPSIVWFGALLFIIFEQSYQQTSQRSPTDRPGPAPIGLASG
jgi:ABC-type uncharacterized transport system permease subunit